MKLLETGRLILRAFCKDDLGAMFVINQDPDVMRYFPDVQDLKETKDFVNMVCSHFEQYGYSPYATIRKDSGEFIGFIGLMVTNFNAHFTPAIEIGWRLSYKHWGQGLATEGAKAVLKYAFNTLKMHEIVSFTALKNIRSINVMKKIGLLYDVGGDFDHPKLIRSSNLRRHVLFKLSSEKYFSSIAKARDC